MKLRSTIIIAVQFAAGVGLEYCLISGNTLKKSNTTFGEIFGSALVLPLILAVALFGVLILVATWRWGILLRVQEVRLPFLQLLRLTFIGQFFNLVLPGAVSGDFVKMAYVAKAAPGKGAEAILTIMLDRIMGLLGLFFMATLCVLLSLPFLAGLGAEQRGLQLSAYIVGAGSAAGILGLLAVEFRQWLLALPVFRTIVPAVGKLFPQKMNDLFTRFAGALELYRRNRGAVLACLAISVIVHAGMALTFICIGTAFSETQVPAKGYFLAAQIGNAVAAIPVTPGGIGMRDNAVGLFLQAQGCATAIAGMIPVVFSLVMLFWGVIGGGVFIFSRGKGIYPVRS